MPIIWRCSENEKPTVGLLQLPQAKKAPIRRAGGAFGIRTASCYSSRTAPFAALVVSLAYAFSAVETLRLRGAAGAQPFSF